MPAYIILDIQELPEDPRKMRPYQETINECLARFGGCYRTLIRHSVTTLEGAWPLSKGIVILEFPSHAQALAFYQSPEYAPLLEVRLANMRANTILVDGLDPGATSRTPGGGLDEWEKEQLRKLEEREREAQASRS